MTPVEYLRANSAILEQLRSYEDRERHQAVSTFKKLGRERGAAVCLYLLEDETYDDYRGEAVLARLLADWKDPRAMPYLLAFVRHSDQGVARLAAEGLESFPSDPNVRATLMRMLESPVVTDRRSAAGLLAKPRIGGREAITRFGERFRDEKDPNVRALFLLGIRDSRHPQRREFLINALTDPDEALRDLAWNQLRRYEDLPAIEFDANGDLQDRAQAIALLRLWEKKRSKRS